MDRLHHGMSTITRGVSGVGKWISRFLKKEYISEQDMVMDGLKMNIDNGSASLEISNKSTGYNRNPSIQKLTAEQWQQDINVSNWEFFMYTRGC